MGCRGYLAHCWRRRSQDDPLLFFFLDLLFLPFLSIIKYFAIQLLYDSLGILFKNNIFITFFYVRYIFFIGKYIMAETLGNG